MKTVFYRIILGVIITFFVLLILNKLMGIDNNFVEMTFTAIVIVLCGQFMFMFFKPYKFK